MEQRAVIDETFAGLVSPKQTFEMGRPELTENRPGTALVEEVRDFDAKGGFRQIAEDRETVRANDEKADAAAGKTKRHADLGIVTKGVDDVTADRTKD
ncbi:hypothetical protein G6L37_03710 [Agrobacterium rubi]|nr:hypothetical protein [Agrobacterium rubi]NTF24458.1 hypothetical protein [Agrobacterium rubi]